ncbi:MULTISPECIES: hypothetical protein [Mesobacillus]|uniref:hypothetical protein n=1 Tax=Mesobacillus TaxID=2675231 RepID=UPI0017853A37|nr:MULTISPECIES: hypothetical protein [Mesobacillus]MCM3572414.1 hypothetical protein [Mesobacillus subterraneus]UYZ23897.1 hypothetical protein FOF60_10320 [Mesobacillus jeotgali]
MQNLQYSPEVKLLLVNQSDEKVKVLYNDNSKRFEMPKIGARPPYYAYPRYEQYYPII